jgi:hypothetical protein
LHFGLLPRFIPFLSFFFHVFGDFALLNVLFSASSYVEHCLSSRVSPFSASNAAILSLSLLDSMCALDYLCSSSGYSFEASLTTLFHGFALKPCNSLLFSSRFKALCGHPFVFQLCFS